MAWIFKNRADIEEFFAAVTGGSEAFHAWFVDHLPVLLPPSLHVTDVWQPQGNIAQQLFQSGADTPANVQIAAPTPAVGIASLAAVAGTPGADVFPLDIWTLMAAVAPTPEVVQISGYSAAQGDVVDLSAVLRGSYAPLTAETAQVRVTEDASAAFATLDFNAGSAQDPHWVALAKLDGVQAGDTVSVALDATHTVALQSTWLA